MMTPRKLVAVTVLAAFAALPAAAAEEWTGYVTDTHCAKNGANKDHGADCVDKCIKGGSKPQLWNEADQKAYNLDDFAKVRALMGGKVTVKGTLDAGSNTIRIESASRAEAGEKDKSK